VASRLAGSSYRLGTERLGDIGRSGQLPVGVDTTEGHVDKSVDPTILFVGTWAGRKRGWLAHRAFTSSVRGFVPRARLVMVSDVAPEELDVELIRAPDDEHLGRLYAEAWVVCLPSSYEGFGMPYLEALAVCAVPVATPNPGADYVLDGGRYGLIVRPRDLGPALRNILSNTTLRDSMARAGRNRAAEFAWPIVAEMHLAAYRRAVASNQEPDESIVTPAAGEDDGS
jgi:glycosyltransferase involved in cell wall biosynthesis